MKNNIINYIEQKYIKKKKLKKIKIGNIINVQIWVIESNKKRLQSFKGIIISKKNKGINTSFILRKISYGEGVERLFKLYSPIIHKITVIKNSKNIKKSKLYYLRKYNKKIN